MLDNLDFFNSSRPVTWKGAVAGLVGGLAATYVMTQAQNLMGTLMPDDDSDSEDDSDPTTVEAAEAVTEGVFNYELSEDEKPIAGQTVHYTTGAVGGLLYGMAAEHYPEVTTGAGLPFGAAFWVIADGIAVPATGLSKAPWKYPASIHLYGIAAHLVYGLAAEAGRSLVRRWL